MPRGLRLGCTVHGRGMGPAEPRTVSAVQTQVHRGRSSLFGSETTGFLSLVTKDFDKITLP